MQHRRIQPHVLALAAAALCSQFAYAADTELPMVTVQTAAASDPLHGTSSATKLDVPLRDVPQSVQFVDKELIRAQGAVDMKDVLRNVSGVAPSQGKGGATSSTSGASTPPATPCLTACATTACISATWAMWNGSRC